LSSYLLDTTLVLRSEIAFTFGAALVALSQVSFTLTPYFFGVPEMSNSCSPTLTANVFMVP
jgi:hypothetical protein